MSDAQPIATFVSGLPMEELTPARPTDHHVFEIVFECYVGNHQYSQREYFYGIHEHATQYAERTAKTYWNTWDEMTKWDEQEQAWVAHDPYRGVRIGSVTQIDGLTCEALFGKYLVQFKP